ncbi:hypothetical protein KY285_026787 [Solanum tuberosum]|nr:hypothetical protein KY285_026787 [Solanum tuberosum]
MKDNQLIRKLQQVNNTVKDTSKMQQGKKSHDQGDQWQTQKKKQNKHQEQANPKTVWKPTDFQHKEGMENQQNPSQADVQEHVTNSLYGLDTNNKTLTKEDQTSQDPGKENPYAGTSARQQEKEGLHSQIPQKDAGNTPTQPSNNEYDKDTQSLDDNDDEEDEITITFGATFQTDYEEEIQEIKRQQGLSPRGRKETRHNTTRARSRPLTRDRSRGL